jgi:xanthine phosphoribosyltransferase
MVKLRSDLREHHVSWQEVHRDIKTLARHLLERGSDGGGPWRGVVAVTRGGLVPAAVLARELDLRVVETLGVASYDEQEREGLRVLKAPDPGLVGDGHGWVVIDDIADTGATLREARRLLPRARFVAVFVKPAGRDLVDAHVHEVAPDTWVFFPWDTEPRYVAPLAAART